MSVDQIAIYGAGGFAREIAWLVESCNAARPIYKVVCFIDDHSKLYGSALNGIPVMSLLEAAKRFPQAQVVGAIGAPAIRQRVMEKAAASGFKPATLIHPRVEHSQWVAIGAGSVICAGSILTTNVLLEEQVQINLGCTIGHDVIMGSYTTLAPGVHISGYVHLGKRVYIGTGAVIINGTQDEPLVIGDDAVIGAGACVLRSVPAGVTAVGVPAKSLASTISTRDMSERAADRSARVLVEAVG